MSSAASSFEAECCRMGSAFAHPEATKVLAPILVRALFA
jgi:hypothetical protein